MDGGFYDGDADWAKKLDFYNEIDKPFENIGELFSQWRRFRNPRSKNNRFVHLRRKRKPSHFSDDSDVDDSSSRRYQSEV